ncbi:MAG TPA: hypothetical protein PKA88_31500, partial [Polyangiaceae bacterium]|nr:hypothetical protein [Polyangiaceae bacterium]
MSARANVPEFEDALRGRARAEYFEVCPTASTVGSACTGTVCGKTITLDPGGNAVLRNIDIDGQVFNLHSPQNKPDLAVADLLNAQCDGSFAATSDVIAMQDMLIADVAQRASLQQVAPSVLRGGLFYERGSDNNAGVAPFSFAQDLSRSQFLHLSGALSYASRPDASQVGLSLMPSWALKMDSPRLKYGIAAYAPLHVAHASIAVIDESVTQWAAGVGGIFTGSTLLKQTGVHGGVAVAARQTHSTTTLPASVLARVTHPVSLLVDIFASGAYGLDPLNAGTGFADLRAGAALGEWEVAYRALLGKGYTAHVIGFMYSYELAGQAVLDEAPAAPTPAPAPTP